MKKLLFILLFPFLSHGIILPSHYGSEFGVGVEGEVDLKHFKVFNTKFHLDVLSTKLIKDRLMVSTDAVIGSEAEDMGVGASLFIKVSDLLYVGARGQAGAKFDFDHNVTILTSFNVSGSKIEPYLTIDTDTHGAANFGGRFYWQKNLGFTFEVKTDKVWKWNDIFFTVRLSYPIKDFDLLSQGF